MNAWYSFLLLVCFPALARSSNTSFIFAIILCSKSKWMIIKKNLFKQKSSFIMYFKKLYHAAKDMLLYATIRHLRKQIQFHIVFYSGPHIFTEAFRQPKSFRSFLPINVKINLSSGIRLKKKICFISIFSFRVLELFQSNAWKLNLLSHLTSVFIVHLSVLVVSDLWDDCNRKNIQLFFLSFLHYDSTSFSSQGYDYSS